MRNFLLCSHKILWSSGLARWYDKQNMLYDHYRNVYGHQTWQSWLAMRGAHPQISMTLWFTWSCEDRMTTIISSRAQCLKLPNLAGYWLILGVYCIKRSITLWSHDLLRSLNKLKALYHDYHKPYYHQNWLDEFWEKFSVSCY